MDFSTRGNQPQHSMPTGPSMEPVGSHSSKGKNKANWQSNMIIKWANVIFTFAVVVVLIGLLVFIAYDKVNIPGSDNEGKFVATTKLQAVFLNTGQVYFGNIRSLNVNYLTLDNIFYLQSQSTGTAATTTTSSSNVTLVKLGCELHAPLDQMVINRSSVTFWENLSPSGQVAQAVVRWQKANPNGQKCSDQSTAGTSGTTSTQSTAK
jgi:hypothetical protein